MQTTAPYKKGTFTRIFEDQKGKKHPLIFTFRKLKQCSKWADFDIGLQSDLVCFPLHDFYYVVANSGLQDPKKTAKGLCEIETVTDWDGTEYVKLCKDLAEEIFGLFSLPSDFNNISISEHPNSEEIKYWKTMVWTCTHRCRKKWMLNWRKMQAKSKSIYSSSTIGVQKTEFHKFLSKHCAPGEDPIDLPVIMNPYYPKGRYPLNTTLYFVLQNLFA